MDNNETAKIGVRLDLDLTNVDSAFGKIQKEIKNLGDKAEVTMAKLNPKQDIFKSISKDYEKIAQIQQNIINQTNKDKSLAGANSELRQQLLWLESIKVRLQDNLKVANSTIMTNKTSTKEIQNQATSVERLSEKFAGLSREARSLNNHYKTLGSKDTLGKLQESLKDIGVQQKIISELSAKRTTIMSSAEITQLDTATKRYKDLRNQVAELSVKLGEVPF